jgi:hypothetical protein
MKEKFKQSADCAEELLKLCKVKLGTDNTVLEAEAYYLFLKGQALAENEKAGETAKIFKEALRCMIMANEIYGILKKDKDALTQIIYKEKMDQIEPFIRLSLFKLGVDTTKSTKYLDELKAEVAKEVSKEMEIIQKEKTIKLSMNYIEVNYGGKTIPLKTELLQNLYKGITKQLEEINNVKTNAEKISKLSLVISNRGIFKTTQHHWKMA